MSMHTFDFLAPIWPFFLPHPWVVFSCLAAFGLGFIIHYFYDTWEH